MSIHLVFDILAWLTGLSIRFYLQRLNILPPLALSPGLKLRYNLVMLLGASVGALVGGTSNLALQFDHAIGHSVLGAIIGGIAFIELFKWRHGIKGSTGAIWVLPLAVGIAVGRWGCFFAGLPDYTFGTPTRLPWGVDFGDGIARHPVQLYESMSMLLFASVAFVILKKSPYWFGQKGFYLFVTFYAAQRFAWEFLKPYPKIIGQLNIFHLMCLLLMGYGVLMLHRKIAK